MFIMTSVEEVRQFIQGRLDYFIECKEVNKQQYKNNEVSEQYFNHNEVVYNSKILSYLECLEALKSLKITTGE